MDVLALCSFSFCAKIYIIFSLFTILNSVALSKFMICNLHQGLPGGSDGNESTCNAGDLGSIPGLGGSLEEGLTTHSSIPSWRIPMESGAWQATIHGVAKSQT